MAGTTIEALDPSEWEVEIISHGIGGYTGVVAVIALKDSGWSTNFYLERNKKRRYFGDNLAEALRAFDEALKDLNKLYWGKD